jgi:hypothetical protein
VRDAIALDDAIPERMRVCEVLVALHIRLRQVGIEGLSLADSAAATVSNCTARTLSSPLTDVETRPASCRSVQLYPGRGTYGADQLRAVEQQLAAIERVPAMSVTRPSMASENA